MHLRFISLFALMPLIAACDLSVLQPKEEHIAVVGRSSVSALPDLVEFRVTLNEKDATKEGVSEKIARASTNLVSQVVDFGVPTEYIATAQFVVSPDYDRVRVDDRWVDQHVGYEATYGLDIQYNDFTKLAELLEIVARYASEISNPSYSVADRDQLREQVRQSAVENALAKAEEYAAASGRSVGEMMIVEERDVNEYRLYPTLREEFAGGLDGREWMKSS